MLLHDLITEENTRKYGAYQLICLDYDKNTTLSKLIFGVDNDNASRNTPEAFSLLQYVPFHSSFHFPPPLLLNY